MSTDMLAPFEPLTVEIEYAVNDDMIDGLLLGVAIKAWMVSTSLARIRILSRSIFLLAVELTVLRTTFLPCRC